MKRRCPVCKLNHPNGPRRAMCVQVPHRWPLGPLVAMTGQKDPGEINRALQRETNELRRAAEFGLTDDQADRWAIRAGYHPAQVWGPEWIDAGLSVVDRQFLDSGWRQAWVHAENERSNATQEVAA